MKASRALNCRSLKKLKREIKSLLEKYLTKAFSVINNANYNPWKVLL